MVDKKPKVVFTFVEAGMGHIIPMTGICQSFERKYGDKCQVVKSYIFSESKDQRVRKMGEELSNHTKRTMRSKLYNKFEAFSYCFGSKFTLKILDWHFRKAHAPFFKEYKELNADLIVSSYYLPSHLARLSNKKGFTNSLIVTYTPDSYVYPAWDRNCDLFLVNNDYAYQMAIKKGLDKKIVKQVPFVFKDSVINLNLSKTQARQSLEIKDCTKPTVLFTNGAYGAKNNQKILKQILKADLDINLIVVCGKNEQLLEQIELLKNQIQTKTQVYAVGFTDKLAEYMRASDFVIGKSGMNTVMESIYLDCPMLICAEANRLEEMITKFCLKENLAKSEKNPKKIVEFIKRFINGEEVFLECRKNFKKYQLSDGAERSADLIFELLKTRFNDL